MLRLFFLLILIGCGTPENNSLRCYSKEEALAACVVDEISKTGVTTETATLICKPYYEAEMCYDLNL